MRRIVLSMAFFLGLGLSAFAQTGGHHGHERLTAEERVEKQTARMEEHLGLSAEQVAAIQPILLAHHQKMDAQRSEAKQLREERRGAMQSLKLELEKVLDEEQMQKLEELHKEHRNEMRRQRRNDHESH